MALGGPFADKQFSSILSTLTGQAVSAEQAAVVRDVAIAVIRGYTRGRGFNGSYEPPEDVESVVISVSARMLANPLGVQRESMGGLDVHYGNGFLGFTLPELAILNRYRERAT